MKEYRRTARTRFERDVLPAYRTYVQSERARDLRALDDASLLALLHERRRKVLDDFGPESLLPGFIGGSAFAALEAQLERLLGPVEGRELARTLTLALEGDTTFEQDALLHDVAGGRATIEAFIDRFGHRAVGEMELAVPRWREHRAYIEQTLGRLRSPGRRGPQELHADGVARRAAAEASLPGRLEACGGSCFLEEVLADLRDARELLPYRESGKFYLMLGYELIRQAIEEMARRADFGVAVYFLTLEELARLPADAPSLLAAACDRQTDWRACQRIDMPDIVDSAALDSLGQPPALATGQNAFEGVALAPGVNTGIVRVIHDPAEAGELGTGYILVCASTDPAWTPLFLDAHGLVVERGGVLSHGAIVARDFGMPAVACPHATRLLQSGDTVKVDGNRGTVVVLQRGTAHA